MPTLIKKTQISGQNIGVNNENYFVIYIYIKELDFSCVNNKKIQKLINQKIKMFTPSFQLVLYHN